MTSPEFQILINEAKNDLLQKDNLCADDFLNPTKDKRAEFISVCAEKDVPNNIYTKAIPKKIHQIWFGDISRRPINKTDMWEAYSAKLGYKYKLWTDSDDELLKNFMKPENYELMKFHKNMRNYWSMSDICREEILVNYGGIYADADFFPPHTKMKTAANTTSIEFVDFADFISMEGATFFNEWNGYDIGKSGLFIMNGFQMACPNHPIQLRILDSFVMNHVSLTNCKKYPFIRTPDVVTGPFLLTTCVNGTFNVLDNRALDYFNMDDHIEWFIHNKDVAEHMPNEYVANKKKELMNNPNPKFATFYLPHQDPWAKHMYVEERAEYSTYRKGYFNDEMNELIHIICYDQSLTLNKIKMFEDYANKCKYQFKVWDLKDDSCMEDLKEIMVLSNYTFMKDLLLFKENITSCINICKYSVIQRYGGFYFDHTKMDPPANFKEMIKICNMKGLILTNDEKSRHIETCAALVTDYFIGACAYHPIITRVVNSIRKNYEVIVANAYTRNAGEQYRTGAYLLNKAIFGTYTIIEKNTFDILFNYQDGKPKIKKIIKTVEKVNEVPGSVPEQLATLDMLKELLSKVKEGTTEHDNVLYNIGNKYKEEREYKEAIDAYRKLSKNADGNIAWKAKNSLADCCIKMNDWNAAIICFMEIYNQFPHRAEPLYEITNYYRLKGMNHLAIMHAKEGLRLRKPDNAPDVIDDVYNFKLHEEISICAYYTGEFDLGMEACDYLRLTKDTIPEYIRKMAFYNSMFYLPKLHVASTTEIMIPLDSKYYLLNPTILYDNSGYTVICRAINYRVENGKYVQTESTVNSKNYILRYDTSFKITACNELTESTPRPIMCRLRTGLEDMHLFKYRNKTYFSCSACDGTNNIVSEIYCGIIDNNQITQITKLKVPEGVDVVGITNVHERNWLPFVQDDTIHFIYKTDPMTILKMNDSYELEVVRKYDNRMLFTSFRGSAAPIQVPSLNNNWLYVIHESVQNVNDRNYVHRFVQMNDKFDIVNISNAFYFSKKQIEFCCGISLTDDGKDILLSYGVNDNAAFISKVSIDTIKNLMYHK